LKKKVASVSHTGTVSNLLQNCYRTSLSTWKVLCYWRWADEFFKTSQGKRKLCNKSTKSFYQLRYWKFAVMRKGAKTLASEASGFEGIDPNIWQIYGFFNKVIHFKPI